MSPIAYPRNSSRTVRFSHPLLLLCLVVAMAAIGCAAENTPPAAQLLNPPQATNWPVELAATEGRIEIYQPQPEMLKGDMLTARSVVSLARAGAAAPTYGTAWFIAHVDTDRDTRTVTIRDVTVKDVRVPGSTAVEQEAFGHEIGARLSAAEVTFPLDQLTASLDTAQREQIEATRIETAPPHILISSTPAALISINGAPRLQPLEGQPNLSRVANTPFIILSDDAAHRYYIKAGPRWVTASDISGPWTDTASVPPAITAAGTELSTPEPQSSPSFTQAAAAPPQNPPPAADARIIVVTEPTELIVTTGDPKFTPIPGSAGDQLLYASNTDSDLFLSQTDHHYYVLLSGRWYTAASLQGPWSFVASNQLPATFAQIPADSPKADVLAFVAATPEAHEAVLDASIPQTAQIRRDAGKDLSVAYDGTAQFKDVPESPGVAYAVNTPEDVLRVNGRYYACHQAVWYESDTPDGPWAVCVFVPPAIYTLPPSCPAYHVRYVYAYDYHLDYVTFGYLPGYTGTYIYGPTIVYGTGYNYPGWYGTAYFPPPMTWGFGACYDPFAFSWGFDIGFFWRGPGWFCHPWHERWWRDHPHERWGEHRWWGPGGFEHARDIRGHFAEGRGGRVFDRGGRGSLGARMPGGDHRGAGWNNLYARDGNTARTFAPSRTRPMTAARPVNAGRPNAFAGSDGRVFRRSDNGWEQHNGPRDGWSGVRSVPDARPTYHPAPAPRNGAAFGRPEAGLDQHLAARDRGAMRSEPSRSVGGGGSRGGGGGGGFRGGGGGRR